MKRISHISIIVFFAMGLYAGAYAAVEPVIYVNGMTGTVNVAADSPVTIKAKLTPGEKEGTDADWWLVCNAFGRWFYYTLDGKWTDIGESPDIGNFRPAYQGKLVTLPSSEIVKIPKLPAGNYTLYFGTDTNMNGKLDSDSLVFGATGIIAKSDISSYFEIDCPLNPNYPGILPWTVSYDSDLYDASITRAIEQADIVGNRRTYLYLLNKVKGLTICDISDPNSPLITGRVALTGKPAEMPNEMYVRDKMAYIIVSSDIDTPVVRPESRILIMDIGDKTNPKLAGTFDLKKRVTDYRLVRKILYAVSWDRRGWSFPSFDFSKRNINVTSIDISDAGNIRVADSKVFSDADNIREADSNLIGGTAGNYHITDKAIFIRTCNISGSNENTTITYLDISDPSGKMTIRGSTKIADEANCDSETDYHNGYLRLLSKQWKVPRKYDDPYDADNLIYNLYVIETKNPDQLKTVGSSKLGEGGSFSYGVRFEGDRAYLENRTKEQMRVIDLSDPANPAVKGELIVPGGPRQIEPDGNRLIILGGDGTADRKTSLSLFDVSNPEKPGLFESVFFGGKDNGWSAAAVSRYSDNMTVADDMGLILLNTTVYTPEGLTLLNTTGHAFEEQIDNRLRLIDYSDSDLTARGWISRKGDVLPSRSLPNRLFSVSGDELRSIDISDRDHPEVTARLTLALNIRDFVPLANGYGVQVTERDGRYVFRAVPLSDPDSTEAVSETIPGITSYFGTFFDGTQYYSCTFVNGKQYYSGTFVNGNLLYVISNEYFCSRDMAEPIVGKTRIRIIDFSIPASPVERGSIETDGNYPGSPNSYSESDRCRGWGQVLLMKDNILLIPYYYAQTSWCSPKLRSVIKITDLSDPDHPKLLSEFVPDHGNVSRFFLNGSMLHFSYAENIGSDEKNNPRYRYYLGRADLSNPSEPVRLPSVNIPGLCIGTDKSGRYVHTVNVQMNGGSLYQTNTFNSVKLDNDKAYPVSSIKLERFGIPVAEDGFFYKVGDDGITIIDANNPEKPKVYDYPMNNSTKTIAGVKNRKIFVNTFMGISCYDASDPANLRLIESVGHGGYAHLEYSGSKAYLPMGYYGVWVKDIGN